uniref:Uncharacterized protein n=1 Tax=Arundo donax TaxID=35708 RepID=A0A0A9A0D7_ARUDO
MCFTSYTSSPKKMRTSLRKSGMDLGSFRAMSSLMR